MGSTAQYFAVPLGWGIRRGAVPSQLPDGSRRSPTTPPPPVRFAMYQRYQTAYIGQVRHGIPLPRVHSNQRRFAPTAAATQTATPRPDHSVRPCTVLVRQKSRRCSRSRSRSLPSRRRRRRNYQPVTNPANTASAPASQDAPTSFPLAGRLSKNPLISTHNRRPDDSDCW